MFNEIKYLFPNATPEIDFTLQDDSDGAGVYIKTWNTAKLGTQPTSAQITAASTAANTPPVKTVLELDIEKYKRRADAKPLLMAKMAAMNVGRLKNGTWTTAQLVSLMSDPEIKSLVSHMETLSFELGIGVINSLTNPIITPAIKEVWIAELTAAL